MTTSFQPDYHHLVDAARNREARRLPLYEHIVSEAVMERVLGRPFAPLARGGEPERREYLRQYARFFLETGYDTVSFERLVSAILPGSGALYAHRPGCIKEARRLRALPLGAAPIYTRGLRARLSRAGPNDSSGDEGGGRGGKRRV